MELGEGFIDTYRRLRLHRASMSCIAVGDSVDVCANCGKGSHADGEDGTIKLEDCTACGLVKYCGVDCQRAHRKQHKKACKKRAAELKDEQLYSQGLERPEGDFCPICTLPIPLPIQKHSVFNVCCMKRICDGCNIAAQKRGMVDCAFCRTPLKDNDADMLKMARARVAKKDPAAIYMLGQKYFYGGLGLRKNMRKAVELWTEAAALGSIEALYCLGTAYDIGNGVQEDKVKAVQFWTEAAMQGHVESRYDLGFHDLEQFSEERNYRAVKHFLISAKLGHSKSVEAIKQMFMGRVATKDHYAQALRGYQDATEEMKSPQRDEAKALFEQSRLR